MDGYKLFHNSAEVNEWVNQHYTKEEVDTFRIGDNEHIGLVLYKGNGSRSFHKLEIAVYKENCGRMSEMSEMSEKMSEMSEKSAVKCGENTVKMR